MMFSIGFSPCPNDTFIFDALVNQRIDTDGISFQAELADIERLNEAALRGQYDICKVSYALIPRLAGQYRLLNAGGALGRGVGPLLICHDANLKVLPDHFPVAIPGPNTTAHLLFSHAYPGHTGKTFMSYDRIESFVQSGKGAGVIIHENRFTYRDKGLFLLNDLGSFWEQSTGSGIPLGGIVIRNELPDWMQVRISQLIADSIRYGWKNHPQLSDFVKSHAREMDESVMLKHIDLYVNDFSLGLGPEGLQAIAVMTTVLNNMFGTDASLTSFLPAGD